MQITLKAKRFLSRRMIKTTILSIGLYTIILLSFYGLGCTMPSWLLWSIGLLAGLSGTLIVDLVFSGRQVRRDQLRRHANYLRRHGLSLVKFSLFTAIAIFCAATRNTPTEPLIKQGMILVETGTIAFLIYQVFQILTNPDLENLLPRALWFLIRIAMAYQVALWLIGSFGDFFLHWASTNPAEAAVLASSSFIVGAIVKFSTKCFRAAPTVPETVVASTLSAQKTTAQDDRYTSTHEAGHALIYAALDKVPADIKVAINGGPDPSGALGFVSGINYPHLLTEKPFAEWQMLVLLAGKEAELSLSGETVLGCLHDYSQWLNIAHQYLANHYRGIYYSDPKTSIEQKHNDAKLEALKAEQKELLQSLFDKNRDILEELANTLLEARKMGWAELMQFWNQVKLPEGFPRPKLAKEF